MRNKFFEIIGLIAIIAFAGLACSSDSGGGGGSGGVTMDVPGTTLAEKMEFLNDPSKVRSNSTYTLNFDNIANVNETDYTPGYSEYDEDDATWEKYYMFLEYLGKTNITINFTGGGTIKLSSKGVLLYVGPGVTVILENITLEGFNNNDNKLVAVDGNLIMEDGSTITGNTDTERGGGGVRVYSGGTFTMNGGSISNNKSTRMDGGAGGVFVTGTGIFIMNGGTISGNTSVDSGGGVWVETDLGQEEREEEGLPFDINAKFIMNGGTISNNKAIRGGGVYVSDGAFEMNGGTISVNEASVGGGVYVNGWTDVGIDFFGVFTMNGGTIYGSDDPSLQNTVGGGSANSLRVDGSSSGAKATYSDGSDIISGGDGNIATTITGK